MIFGVSRGPPTEEVMIFVVSQGVPTDPLQEVMIFGVPLRAPTELTKRQTDIFLVTSGCRWLWETLYSK